jgi:hypothetical protein
MLALELFSWWYGKGWYAVVSNMRRRLLRTSHLFSLPVLIRTLFAPWRRIITYPGSSLGAQFRAITDNTVSRVVGLCVRLSVLITASLMLVVVFVSALIGVLVWPLIPILVPLFLVLSIVT